MPHSGTEVHFCKSCRVKGIHTHVQRGQDYCEACQRERTAARPDLSTVWTTLYVKAALALVGCILAGVVLGWCSFCLLFWGTNNEGFMGIFLLMAGGGALLGLVVGVLWAARILGR